MRAPDLCPGHSLEAPGGEEEQLSGQRPHGAQPGGGQRLLGAILGCLQLRDPVGEPPVGCVPGGWGMGERKLPDRLTFLAPFRHPLLPSTLVSTLLGPQPPGLREVCTTCPGYWHLWLPQGLRLAPQEPHRRGEKTNIPQRAGGLGCWWTA